MMNPAAETITGWREDEAAGKSFSSVFRVVDLQTRQPLPDPTTTVLESGMVEGWARDNLLIRKDGGESIIVGSAAPIHDLAGQAIGAVVVFRDMTEHRKLEEEMAKVERLESVGVLAGGIAHDFNNILSAVLGNISIARMATEDLDFQQARLAEAEKAALRARDLTQQLLTFSRGGEPVRKTTRLDDLVKEAASFALRGSNVLSEITVAEGLWPAEVDEGQISRVINNMVINADQAMPNGGRLKITLYNVDVTEEMALPLQPGRFVRIDIQDEGVGIPEEYLQKIFDPFFTTKRRGSGLGLATSFSIVQKHQGFVTVSSQTGQGTTFSIYLPAVSREVKSPEVKEAQDYRGEGRILVMDDEEVVLDVARVMLERLGFTVDTARDGNSAIELYLKARMDDNPYKAVIMDLTIPGGMGGEEAIRHLKKLDKDVCAIVSSGYSNDPIMSNYQEYGFSGVVAKPYRLEDLSKALAELLSSEA